MAWLTFLAACSNDPCARPAEDLSCDLFVGGGAAHCRYAKVNDTAFALTMARARVDIYYLRHRAWPTDWADVADAPPSDGWGRPLVLEPSPDGVRIVSYGADGVAGGACEAADLFEWARTEAP